jgi:sugar lactone lactonase YvrE
MDSMGEVSRDHVGTVAAVLRPRAGGGVVIGVERGFAFANDDLSNVEPLGALWTDPTVRMNEGGCDPQGRFYCGSMAYDGAKGRGRLYRLEPNGTTHVVLPEVSVSNGLAWSPGGDLAYYVDTPTQRIDVFDFDPGSGLHDRRPFVLIDPALGSPDGLTVDASGCVWVALFGGSAVHQYSPLGRLEQVVEVLVSQVTACNFGGTGLDELYITTSRKGLGDTTEGAAGALFAASVGVVGQPVIAFAG